MSLAGYACHLLYVYASMEPKQRKYMQVSTKIQQLPGFVLKLFVLVSSKFQFICLELSFGNFSELVLNLYIRMGNSFYK